MTKKIMILVGAVLAIASITWLNVGSLEAPEESQFDSQRLQVLTTFSVLADMAQNVAGEFADVRSIVEPGAEVHGYEPTPRDIIGMKNVDLVLDNGMGLELWADKLYQNAPDAKHVTLTEGIKSLPVASDSRQAEPNPHAWMSPANALKYVDNIEVALSRQDPENSANYQKNATKYKAEIKALDVKLRQNVAKIPTDRRYIVTCEGAFSYLAKDYGLNELYLWPINSDSEGTPRQVAALVDQVKQQHIPAVFCESTVNSKAQEQVADETGAKFGGILYIDSLSDRDGPAPTYLKLLEHNINTFVASMKV